MLSVKAKTPLYIKKRYQEIKEFYINKEIDDIYHLIPHSLRYNILKYTLKFTSLPITVAIQIIKFITLDTISLEYFNISNILLDKMNQSILKKITQSSSKEIDEIIPKIVEYVLKEYEKYPELVEQPKPLLLENFITKVKEYVPFISKFMNFWDQGGVKYSKEMIEKQKLVEIIYKRIISVFYVAGKNGEILETEDIKKLFPEIDFKEFEEKVELVNTETVRIEENSLVPLACAQPPIPPKPEKVRAAIDSNNTTKLQILDYGLEEYDITAINSYSEKTKANSIIDLCDIFEEHCIATYLLNNSGMKSLPLEPYRCNTPIIGYNTELISCY